MLALGSSLREQLSRQRVGEPAWIAFGLRQAKQAWSQLAAQQQPLSAKDGAAELCLVLQPGQRCDLPLPAACCLQGGRLWRRPLPR